MLFLNPPLLCFGTGHCRSRIDHFCRGHNHLSPPLESPPHGRPISPVDHCRHPPLPTPPPPPQPALPCHGPWHNRLDERTLSGARRVAVSRRPTFLSRRDPSRHRSRVSCCVSRRPRRCAILRDVRSPGHITTATGSVGSVASHVVAAGAVPSITTAAGTADTVVTHGVRRTLWPRALSRHTLRPGRRHGAVVARCAWSRRPQAPRAPPRRPSTPRTPS